MSRGSWWSLSAVGFIRSAASPSSNGSPVKYLLNPPRNSHRPRDGAAITILVLYWLLFILVAWAYFRLLYVVTFHPGYVPRGPQWHIENGGKEKRDRNSRRSSKATENNIEEKQGDFFNKDMYVCKGDGMPVWCSSCLIWKPDRAHHCREVDRCVRKMDHFCPWVGGVVSETSFNFFIQFTGWSAIFSIFNLVHLSVFVSEYSRATGTINVHWVVSLALAGLFALFALGMTGSSLQFVLVNTTTIENLSRKSIVWDLAFRIPESLLGRITVPTVSISPSNLTPNQEPHPANQTTTLMKRYAILHSKPGDNPWDLGAYRNFQSVMGVNWWEWFLPLRHSPCCDHSGPVSQFATGEVVEQMRRDAGILLPDDSTNEKGHHHRKRKRRRKQVPRSKNHSNDSTPDDRPADEGDPQWVRDVEHIV